MNTFGKGSPNALPVNPALTNAIDELRGCTDQSKKQELVKKLIGAISSSSFIMPAAGITPSSQAFTRNNNTVVQPAAKVEIKLIRNGNGDAFFCGFTDDAELAKAKMQNDKRIIQSFAGITEMLKTGKGINGIIINPMGDNVIVTKQMCTFIAEMNGAVPSIEEHKNEPLKKAIEALQQEGTAENVSKMVECAVKSTLIMPAKKAFAPDARVTDNAILLIPRVNVNFMLMNYKNGNSFFGVFTDLEEYAKQSGGENSDYILTDFDNLSNIVLKSDDKIKGFIINPKGRSVTFPKPMIHQIKQQREYLKLDEHTLKSGTKVQFAEPDEYPIDLMAALINHFGTEPDVNAAYLRLINTEDGGRTYFIVVDFVGDVRNTFNAIADVAKPYLDDENELAMMPYSMDFARTAVKGIEPFYKKAEE